MDHFRTELLAPAGSPESLRAAVNAGADAVYVGGTRFGARAYADNPAEDILLDGIAYAHLFGTRIHMTVNTLLRDDELAELDAYMKPYYEAGLDAAIVQDLGVLSVLHRHFPLLPLHASTQMTVTGPRFAEQLKSLGVVRVVPARELSLDEVIRIARETGLETETFVHGALCYSYSGQCLMSSLIGGRSGNRGRCAQPCRLPYQLYRDGRPAAGQKPRYFLNCRDLCSLDLVPQLVSAGITSFKIEGRMKSPRYTAGVTSIWRKYLDLYAREGAEGYHVDPEDRKRLLDLFDRGGQTDGYYFCHGGPKMVFFGEKPDFREGNEALNRYLDETYVSTERTLPVKGSGRFAPGVPMEFTVTAEAAGKEVSFTAFGPAPEPARNAGADSDSVTARLQKTGGTRFRIHETELSLAPGLFIPVGQLNALRRDALSGLEEKILSLYRRTMPAESGAVKADALSGTDPAGRRELPAGTASDAEPVSAAGGTPVIHVTVSTGAQLEAVSGLPDVGEISLESDGIPAPQWEETVRRLHASGKKALLCMPQIFRAEAERYFDERKKYLLSAGFDGFVLRAWEEAEYLRECFLESGQQCPECCFDFNLYGMNREAQKVLRRLGAGRLTLPAELNSRELRSLSVTGNELIVYGRLPMMVSAQCLKKNTSGCDHTPSTMILEDRRGMRMPVRTHCAFCFNTILNAQPLSLAGIPKDVLKLSPAAVRILLTDEDAEASRNIVRVCGDAFLRRGRGADPCENFTRGHFRRGVE